LLDAADEDEELKPQTEERKIIQEEEERRRLHEEEAYRVKQHLRIVEDISQQLS
jgi:hypothetical protein